MAYHLKWGGRSLVSLHDAAGMNSQKGYNSEFNGQVPNLSTHKGFGRRSEYCVLVGA